MAEAQDDTNKKLNCPICLEILESPKVLLCFHTFCEKCICKHVRGLREEGIQSDTISCPMCRNPCPAPATDQTPDDWAAELSNNSILVSILESVKSRNDDPVYCQPCLTEGKQFLSVAYCVTCTEYLCNICYNCHKKFRATKDHTITVQCIPESHILEISQDMYLCSVHQEKHTYFCSDHKEFCCSKCAIQHHRKCEDLSSVDDLAKDFKDRQDSGLAMENLEGLNKMFHKLLENRKKHFDSVHEQKTEVRTSINQWTSSVKELVGKLEKVPLEELEQICKQETVETSDQIIECKSAIAAIEMSQRMLSESEKSDDKTKFMMTFNKVSRQLLKYLQKYDALENRSQEMIIEYHHDMNFEEVIQNLSSLGQVMTEVSRIPILSPYSSFQETVLMLPRFQPDSSVTFNAKIPSDEKTCNICSGIFLPDERIVLCDEGNRKLKLFDRYFHFVSDLRMQSKPRHVCGVDQRTVAVTAGINLYLVTVTNTLTRLKTISHHSYLYGITSYIQNILVCVGGHSVCTYDASYSVIKTVKPVTRFGSSAFCISPDGKMIHYTLSTKIVTIDMEGKELNTSESSDLKGLSGIAVDNRGLVYCCGQESGNVILVTPEGRQLSVLLSGAHGLKSPIGICLNDRNTRIVVFKNRSSEVTVFKLA